MSAPTLPPDIALMRPPDLLRALLSDPDAGLRRHVVAALRYLRGRMTRHARRAASADREHGAAPAADPPQPGQEDPLL